MMPSLFTHWLTPHYSNNHRPKLLQPIGLSVVVAIFLLTQTTLQLTKMMTALPGGYVLGFASSITPEQVVEQTNLERSQAGLPALVIDSKLNQAALAKANHMFTHDYWAHIAPDGTNPWLFIKNAGYSYSVAGENLARDFNDTSSMLNAWMNSPTHKANLVHQKYTQIGIAVVNGKLQGVETTLVVQMFGTPVVAAAKTTPKAAISQAPAPIETIDTVAVPDINEVTVVPAVPEPTAVITAPATLGTNASLKKISPLTVTKSIASILIVLLISVLTYDSFMINKRNLPRKVGNNWAHIAFFGIILVVIMALTEGNIM